MQGQNHLSIELLLVLAGCNCHNRQLLAQQSPPAVTGTTYLNDGGIQYRSIVDLVVPRNELRLSINKLSKVEKFGLFAVVGNVNELAPVKTSVVSTGAGQNKITRKLILQGKQPKTNRLVTRVFEAGNPRWDGCGDGDERPSLILETALATSNLRCCGP